MSFYNSFYNLNDAFSAYKPFFYNMPSLDYFALQTPIFEINNFQASNLNYNWNFNSNLFKFNMSQFELTPPNYSLNNSKPWLQNTKYSFKPINIDFSKYTYTSTQKNNISTSSSYSKTNLHKYANLTRTEALSLASRDSGLEELKNGTGWRISDNSFKNDIPYAKKGTGALLSQISAEIGEDLVVTSALGTKTSPHAKGSSSCSHYNENNPKLDFGGGLNQSEANRLANKLRNTDYFSRVAVEANGDGNYHLDVQIKDSAYNNLSLIA